MTVWTPRRARPHWGAESVCVRCGAPITWIGRWAGGAPCTADPWGWKHRSASAGTPPPAALSEKPEYRERAGTPQPSSPESTMDAERRS